MKLSVLGAVVVLALSAGVAGTAAATPGEQRTGPLLLRWPTISRTQIVFGHAGDLWIVDRKGGDARRLTSGIGGETVPAFSPDGATIAFTGEYDGNLDVYVVPAAGGEPRRLTYHPDADIVCGWTPDGKRILFHSHRASPTDSDKFFTVPVEGGFPTELPLPMADEGVYSPDGARLAYVPFFQWQEAWKRYRGGQTKGVWIASLSDLAVEQVPRDGSNDFNPMWLGDKVYFLSDRNGPVSLFAYDTAARTVTQVLPNDGLDLKSASAGGGAIVYEQFGSLHVYDPATGRAAAVDVRVAGDFAESRPRFAKLDSKKILGASLSPTGQRALFEAHGEILSVPAEKGDIRNLTRSPAVADRDPSWSPDGKSVAYFSDESGEYALHVRDQGGLGETKKIGLGEPPSFFYSPTWSPDSKKIAYSDKRLNLWYVDLAKGKPVKIDTDLFEGPSFGQVWSPDSRFVAYAKQVPNHLHALLVYSLETGKAVTVTDGMSDVLFPDFDKNGKYLYFTASTDTALSAAGGNLSGLYRPVTRTVYVIVLRKDLPSPLAPEKGDEGEDAKKDDAAKDKEKDKDKPKEKVTVTIDFERISQRILAMPLPARNYVGLYAGKDGELFVAEGPQVATYDGPPTAVIQKFVWKTRKADKLVEGVSSFLLSADGEKMLFKQGDDWYIRGTGEPPKGGEGMLKLGEMEVHVDPVAEWRQMYHEIWRIERDFFYDPGHHGLDLKAAEEFYAPYLDGIRSRGDLNYLFAEMLGNITVGHMFVGGGDLPEAPKVKGGLLGADYKIENGRYRFARVYDGENWNPKLQAPLTQPGVGVVAGEYLLAVNGRELRSSDPIDAFFQGTAGRQVVLRVGPRPDATGAREVTVVPIENEAGLRNLAWIEGNRRKVDELTGGRVAYVHLPDTAVDGYTSFNRYYFAQVGKEAAIIDERFNHGGYLADYVVDYLRRPLLNWVATREGQDFPVPGAAIYGPKVMIVNQFAGSGGDALPWYFRKLGIGPIVGTRTWGGLVGIGGYPQLVDGGYVTAPRLAIYGLEGDWEVENRGIAPDIEVEMDPKTVSQGHDPQLEKAVEVVMDLLAKNPPPARKRPPYPNYHQRLPSTATTTP
jgi:tricorn protease